MPPVTRTVSKAVIIALIAVSTAVLALFGSIEYRSASKKQHEQLRSDLMTVAEQLSLSLTLPLWNVENEQAIKIIDSALHKREVHAVAIVTVDTPLPAIVRFRDAEGNPVSGAEIVDVEDLISTQRDILYGGKLLGRVQVFFTTQYVRETLRVVLVNLGLNILALNFFLVTILCLVLNRLVLRPLKAVETYALAQGAVASETSRAPGRFFLAELENLRSSIENMVAELKTRYAELECSQNALAGAEERYRNIFENALAGIFQITPGGRFLTANPAMGTLLGYDSPQELIEKVTDIGRQVYATPAAREELLRILSEQGEVSAYLMEFMRRDGEARWGKFHVSCIRDATGAILYHEGMLEDVTERKRAEDDLAAMARGLELAVAQRTADLARKAEELEAANVRLRELDEIKSAFLSSVSHELRTPMTSVLGFTKLILKDFEKTFQPLVKGNPSLEKKGVRIQENLRIIGQEGERLTRLINDVLDLAKIESGRIFWQDRVVLPETLIRNAVGALRGQFELSPRVALNLNVEVGLPCIKVDPDRVEQVLINLLHNASKFTRSGSVTVDAGFDAAGDLRVRVRDTGSGIPEQELERIFDKFHQVTELEAQRGKPRGTGLGLTLCRQIIEHYGGRIWAASIQGEGSTFTFVIPAYVAEEEQAATPVEAAAEEPIPGRPLLLVVDDDSSVLSYLCQLFESQGFSVVSASDGAAALDAARQHHPDLITMDILMPGMDGETAIRILRRDPDLSNIPILVITVKEGYASGGADATLVKPVDEEKLLDTLHSLLGRCAGKEPTIVLQPNGVVALGPVFAFDAKALQRCDVEDMWARIEAGFQGTVILPPWAVQDIDLQRLVAHSGVRVLIMPEREG